MIQDRLTLSMDLSYRWADVEYNNWSADENVSIDDTDPAEFTDGTTALDRLDRVNSYILGSFLDYDGTLENEWNTLGQDNEDPDGPARRFMERVPEDALHIDLSGLQVHIGLRFYFL